jgi:hypothetical protein
VRADGSLKPTGSFRLRIGGYIKKKNQQGGVKEEAIYSLVLIKNTEDNIS